jgi:hypothetical protein
MVDNVIARGLSGSMSIMGPQKRLSQVGPTFALRSGTPCGKRLNSRAGRVAEWFKAPVLKTGVPARVPWVRIPPLPPGSAISRWFRYEAKRSGSVLGSTLGAQNDNLRWIALAWSSIAARAVVAERPRRLGNIARAHHAGRANHDLLGGTHGRLRDAAVEPSAYDAKLRWRRDAIPAILSGWAGGTLRSWWTCLSRRPCIASITLVTLIALYAAGAKSQRRRQGDEDKNGFPHIDP